MMSGTDTPIPLHMLIVDDSRPYVESLYRDAQRFGICLVHAASLEEGREQFESVLGGMVSGIILDVKCLKERNQEIPDNSFLTAAIKYFGVKAPHLPLAILTGESDLYLNLKELYAGTTRVYSKGRDEREMLTYLAAQAGELEWLKIVRQYRDVFDSLEIHLGMEARQELVSCLQSMGSEDFTVIKNNLGCLRRLQEKIYIALHKIDNNMVPDRYVEGEVNVISIYKSLAEKGCVERYKIIDRFAEMTYKIASDNGAHTPYDNPKYPPTKYTVQSVTFALLDLLLWFKSVVREKGRPA